MTERKIINKHKNIEYQNKKIFILKKKKLIKINFMIPFNLTCLNCNKIISQGKKINAFKEKILNENYFGIQILRFFFKCPDCYKGISIRTDPINASYSSELNCMINNYIF